MDLLATTETLDGDTLTLALRGELDSSTAHVFSAALEKARAHPGPVNIDIGNLTFMDSTGLKLFLQAGEDLGDRLTIGPGQRAVMRVFELTDSVEVLPFRV